MGLLSRVFNFMVSKQEGANSSGPYFLPISNGWLSSEAGGTWNWWQRGYGIQSISTPSAMVEACVSAYGQTVAMCPGDHWQLKNNGGRVRVTTSALSRILKQPNGYQTISDFLLNAVRQLYTEGNCYILGLRNSRFEISELHLMDPRACAPTVAKTGDVFYSLSGNSILERMVDYPIIVPARDVMHLRLNVNAYDPLRGISPIAAAAMDIAAGNAMLQQQVNFYLNQARPSMVLSTDLTLDVNQVQALRDRWNEQAAGLSQGGTPILTAGLKPVPMTTNSVDAQLAEIMKLTEQHVALAFRIPLQILGMGSSPFSSTEALMQSWLASSLGFCLNHIEAGFDKLFGLKGYPDEYTEFNTSALLRSNQKERIDALVRAVQGGVFSPNEARASEGYPAVEYGDEPRVQQQVVPLSAASGIPAPAPAAAPAAPAAGKKPEEATPKDYLDVGDDFPDVESRFDYAYTQEGVRN